MTTTTTEESPSLPSTPDALTAKATRLQGELEATEGGELRALYLHELGLLLERLGDDASAARFYKESYNSAPGFREPLEALVSVFRRRGTYKNVGRLLEALTQLGPTSETPRAEAFEREEHARAQIELAAFLLDHQSDAAGAQVALEAALEANPDDLAAWLDREALAAREGDTATRLEALNERAARASSSTWRALLLLDVAELQASGGDVAKAVATCREAAALEGAAKFRAWRVLEQLGRRERDDAVLAGALTAQADQLEAALANGEVGDAQGVPRYMRTAGQVADLLVQAAEAHRRRGDLDATRRDLARAQALLPDSTELSVVRLGLADATGDAELGASVARGLLEGIESGPEAASLWLRVARAGGDDRIAALTAAVKADPTSVAARALLDDALAERRGEGDAASLASSLEAATEQVSDERTRARFFLRAAWEWALGAKDTAAARAALSQAGALGVPALTLARIGRALAALAGDGPWYDESLKRLLLAGASDGEQAGLWLELAFLRARRQDEDGFAAALDSLARSPGGAWTGRVLGAYLRPLLASEPGTQQTPEAIEALAETENSPEMRRALSLASVWRSQRQGDVAAARTKLEKRLESDASDVLSARYLAGLLQKEGAVEPAAQVLEATAAAVDDANESASLAIEAALMLWRAGQRARSLEPLRFAQGRSPAQANLVLGWALRGVAPNDMAERRRVLDSFESDDTEERAGAALERFGLALTTGDTGDAQAALETIESEAQGTTRLAAALARVAWPVSQDDRGRLDEALSLLATDSDAGALLASVERVRLARDVDESRPDHVRQATVWAEVDPSLEAGLEGLAAALAADDPEAEIAAHRLLASQLEGPGRTAEEAAAVLVQWLTSGGLLPDLLASVDPAAQLLNLELAPAGSDPRRRAAALRAVGGTLGEASSLDALAMAGWSDLASGNYEDAATAFRTVLTQRADDIAAWEGLRTAASRRADLATQAEASARLGELLRDDARAAAFLEEAALLWLDRLGDETRGEQALALSFERDARRAVAFDRLFRRVRQRKMDDTIIDLAQRRLTVTEDEAEIVKLYWEQALVFHKRSQFDDALGALSSVVMFEPDYIGAQVLHGDIYMKQSNWAEAAASFAQLAANTTAPAQQRQQAGVQAVTLYEKRLNDIPSAIEVLVGLNKAGLLTLPLRERLAALAARGSAWPEATAMFEALMLERETPEGRIEAARLAMAIWRDKVSSPKDAKRAVVRLLEESPADAEAIDLVLATDFGAAIKDHALGTGKSTLVQQLQRGALDPDAVALLAKIARGTGDGALLQATLGTLVSLGRDVPNLAEQLADLESRTTNKVPQILIDAPVLAAIADPVDAGPITRLFEPLGEIIAEALGPTKDALGVGRKERVDPRSGLPLRNDIAAWAGAMGLGEFELYIGGRDPNGIQGVGGEVPALVVGANVKSPLSAAARQAIAREVFALKRGTTVVRSRDEATVASIAVAACNLAGVKLEAPPFAILGDVQRQLDKAMNRKVRKLLPDLAQQTVASRPDVRAWARATQRSLDRIAAVAAGDVSLVLSDALGVSRQDLRRQIAGNERAERLLRFVLSPQYLELRNHLGMGVR